MPEQYALPGMLNGQRWRSTGPCRDQRAVGVAGYDVVDNVVCYLMGAPARETLDRFVALGRTLADKGRYPEVVPSRLVGAFELLDAHAAARVLVSPEVVPWRPNLGIYLIVEELTDRAAAAPFLRWAHTDGVPSLLSCPGVAGVWWFGTAARFAQPNQSGAWPRTWQSRPGAPWSGRRRRVCSSRPLPGWPAGPGSDPPPPWAPRRRGSLGTTPRSGPVPHSRSPGRPRRIRHHRTALLRPRREATPVCGRPPAPAPRHQRRARSDR